MTEQAAQNQEIAALYDSNLDKADSKQKWSLPYLSKYSSPILYKLKTINQMICT